MITPQVKDSILSELISVGVRVQTNVHEDYKNHNCSKDEYIIILDQFEKMDLLSQNKLLGGVILISLTADAFDFHSHGGFFAREELLKKNIEKLLLEIENLKPSLPDKIEKITNIVSGIATALSLFR